MGCQNTKLVSHYSKSVSHKNSKCLDFVLVPVTGIVKKSTISPSCYTKSKNDSYSAQWFTMDFQNIKLVSHYSKSVSREKSKCLDFVLIQVTRTGQKAQSFFHATQNQEMTPIQHNGVPRLPKYQIIVCRWVLAEFRHNRIVQSSHENYFNVCRQQKEK